MSYLRFNNHKMGVRVRKVSTYFCGQPLYVLLFRRVIESWPSDLLLVPGLEL